MNLEKFGGPLRGVAFRTWRSLTIAVPGGRISAFGRGAFEIGAIIVVNLDRRPARWRTVTRELGRFRTPEGAPLTSITRRLAAVDARDGRAVAATVDVDATYRIADHLYVQPDARLATSFSPDEPVRMTPQEVAVARSHVEVWKAISSGTDEFALVLEDDVWFRPGAAAAIDRGWRAAVDLCSAEGGPMLLYLSYAEASGTAVRGEPRESLFRPVRGLWFLSAYVLSREGAAMLLRAMPVVGPVDLWMNYRFAELGALALSSPAIAQRHDGTSDNAYSILPYLARAGIVDAGSGVLPKDMPRVGPVLAWTREAERESLAMALSMLGLRVRAFDRDAEPMLDGEFQDVLKTFDALVDAPLAPDSIAAAVADERSVFFFEADAPTPEGLELERLPVSRSVMLPAGDNQSGSWVALCELLDLPVPLDPFPTGVSRAFRLFRDDRRAEQFHSTTKRRQKGCALDDSPWVLPSASNWRPMPIASNGSCAAGRIVVEASMTQASPSFRTLVETFPGNLASFTGEHVEHSDGGTRLVIDSVPSGHRPYRSGAFASVRSFGRGRFEAEIRAAPGSGLITGFFLYRHTPRQEIDVEILGADPRRMLTNVFFNPGDDGTAMSFGYRGSPCWIDLGFDATAAFHEYAIDWQPDGITWLVDGRPVHARASWDPTPIPHLDMFFHANLWAPRSTELAGRIDDTALPATAVFRNVSITA